MILAYVAKLGLNPQKTLVRAQKIVSLPLKMYRMSSTKFSIHDSLEKILLFKETFLLANTSLEVVLKISFLSLSNAGNKFMERLRKIT